MLNLKVLTQRVMRSLDASRNQRAVRMAMRGTVPQGFAVMPEAGLSGSFRNGRNVLSGKLTPQAQALDGAAGPWAVAEQDHSLLAAHGFLWLEDLAVVGTRAAQRRAQEWVVEWITLFSQGGAAWQPDMAGRRVLEWIRHSDWLMATMNATQKGNFLASLGQHARYLRVRSNTAGAGLARFEMLVGRIHLALCLDGLYDDLSPSIEELGHTCAAQIDADGGIASRNPEELMEIFVLLESAAGLLGAAGISPNAQHLAAIRRIGPALRGLRMGDGTLVRFHGGGTGREGRLDRALAEVRVRGGRHGSRTMGFVRLTGGRVAVVIDCAVPPNPELAPGGHASTLAFEMSSGRRQIFANVGSGMPFGGKLIRSARTTMAHNTLALDRMSSSRIQDQPRGSNAPAPLTEMPTRVTLERSADWTGMWLQASHDGYLQTHGLIHERRMFLDALGRSFHGEDRIFARDLRDVERLEQNFERAGGPGASITIHFHVHPSVRVDMTPGENTAVLHLKGGEVWDFQATGVQVNLEASSFLDPGHPAPVPTEQIVLRARFREGGVLVNWSLSRRDSEGRARRDLVIDEDDFS